MTTRSLSASLIRAWGLWEVTLAVSSCSSRPSGDAAGTNVACEGINNFGQAVCGVTDAGGNVRNFIGTPDANVQNYQ